MTSEAQFNANYTAKMQAQNITELLAALVEQQRIANLIAWLGLRDWDKAITLQVLDAHAEASVVDQIREGLGL